MSSTAPTASRLRSCEQVLRPGRDRGRSGPRRRRVRAPHRPGSARARRAGRGGGGGAPPHGPGPGRCETPAAHRRGSRRRPRRRPAGRGRPAVPRRGPRAAGGRVPPTSSRPTCSPLVGQRPLRPAAAPSELARSLPARRRRSPPPRRAVAARRRWPRRRRRATHPARLRPAASWSAGTGRRRGRPRSPYIARSTSRCSAVRNGSTSAATTPVAMTLVASRTRAGGPAPTRVGGVQRDHDPGQADVDQRPVEDDVDVVEVVAQDRDPDRDRHRGQHDQDDESDDRPRDGARPAAAR